MIPPVDDLDAGVVSPPVDDLDTGMYMYIPLSSIFLRALKFILCVPCGNFDI